ncbi:MAG: TRAP transporter small permease, partial [Deltaproteobacteria bacterium]|nr:TRAP transporter small permease [Deltaproteobacteria bacterium]
MRKLRELEDKLIRVESALAVVLVLVTLSLAGYNVVYRNILVRLQQHWAHSGPPLEEATATTPAATKAKTAPTAAEGKAPEAAGGDDFGGFGGGLGDEAPADSPAAGDDFGGFGGGIGDEDEPEPEPATPEPAAGDDFGGFGGGIGDEDEQPAEPPAKPSPPVDEEPAKAGGDDFGGFGGGIGDEDEPAEGEGEGEGAEGFGGFGGGLGDGEAKPKADDGDEDEEEDDFGEEDDLGGEDPFANLADIDAAGQDGALDTGPKGGPPPVGSFADRAVKFIDAIKLGWIDLFLRQLVIIISFLGAILATQRGKHINIDALSKALPKRFQRVVPIVLNLVSVGACLMLARAGWDLVQISREYPKEVL